jgi:hypothetical protein
LAPSPLDTTSIAFILRFWLEQREVEGALPIWRGVVEHIPTRERHYFENLSDIPTLLAPYLNTGGIAPHKE